MGHPEPQLSMRELDCDLDEDEGRRNTRGGSGKKKGSSSGGAKRRTARLATA